MSDDLSLDGLPEETVGYIKKLRQESANYRTQRNELSTKYTELESKYNDAGTLLAEANKRLDDFSALEDTLETTVKERTEFSTKYDKLRAAAKFGIPDEVDRLKGATYEEWEADAEALSAKLVPGRKAPKDPAAGSKTPAAKKDPLLEAFREGGWV